MTQLDKWLFICSTLRLYITKLARLSTENPTLTTTGRAVYLHCCVRSQQLSSLRLGAIARVASLRWRDLHIGNTDVFLYFFLRLSQTKENHLGVDNPHKLDKGCGDFSKTRDFHNDYFSYSQNSYLLQQQVCYRLTFNQSAQISLHLNLTINVFVYCSLNVLIQ